MMWKTYRHTGSEEDYSIYIEALNQATAEIRNSKRSYEQKIAFNIKRSTYVSKYGVYIFVFRLR